MATEVRWTPQALEDVSNIGDFISRDSFHYAQVQIARLIFRTEILEKFPLAGRVVPELNDPSIRELIEGSYRIVYRVVSPELVDVVTIHHANRLLSNNPKLAR